MEAQARAAIAAPLSLLLAGGCTSILGITDVPDASAPGFDGSSATEAGPDVLDIPTDASQAPDAAPSRADADATTAAADAVGPCPAGYADCADGGSGCTSLAGNPYCGACGISCDAGELCSPGSSPGVYSCTASCTGGTTPCGSSCVDESTNAQPNAPNCGGCGSRFDCTGGKVCQAGACTCPGTQTDCGGTCTNTATDPMSCGACSAPCPGAALGETCSSNRCQAYSLTTASSPFALATDGVNVYYLSTPSPSSATTIAAVPVGGGQVSGPFAAPGAVSIATDAVDVYWGGTQSDGLGFVSLAPTGSIGSASPVISNFTDPVEEVYADVTDGFLKFGVFCDGIFSVPLKTTAAAQMGTTGGFNGCQGSVAAGNFDQVYWANPATAPYTTMQNGLRGLFASASSSTQTLSSAADIRGIALQGSMIYYTDSAGGTVSVVPVDGSKAASAIALAPAPLGLVVDSSNVYWIDGNGTTIMKVASTGGQPTTLATGQSAVAIALDGSSVYWADTNAIMRMPK